MFQTKITFRDILAVLAILIAAALIFLPAVWKKDGATLLVTTPDGDFSYPLSKDRRETVVSGGITLVIVIEDGKAWVSESDCPDGVCRASGKISRSGEVILCAPAGVTLTVKGGSGDVDFVAG